MPGRALTFWLIVIGALGLGSTVQAQSPEGLEDVGVYRDTLAIAETPPFRLRSFIRPGTVTILLNGAALDSTQYRLDLRHGLLELTAPILDPDATLVAAYETWPFAFEDVYRRRSVVQRPESDSTGAAILEEEPSQAGGSDPFGDLRLQRSGSITRGIIAGNNRDVTLESGLRMQLEGEVVDGVNVQAVLTDENTPIQPEGTTQRLNEFDRVFIEIDAQQGTAQLGDFDLNFQASEFARFARKLQGATVFGDLPGIDGSPWAGGHLAVAAATSRGIYRTQDLDPIDGVQGPYRLTGSNNETFIIVIAGSEVVYLDGQRLTRGETNDYVIDYATAEITFTANRIITSDRRITIEFQYTTNQFTRTLVGAETEAAFGHRADGTALGHIGATFIREADSRQFNEELGLTSADSLLLAMSGDEPALRSGAEQVVFDPESPYVQYRRETRPDEQGSVDTVYVALTAEPDEGEPVFRVRFSRLGSSEGSYVRDARSVNGIAYRYVGPGEGDYAPVRLLPRPKNQRLLDLRGSVSPVRGLQVFGEWARSMNDENRLSELGDANDQGDAYTAGVHLDAVPLAGGVLEATVRRRFTGDQFASFDRTRPVEFSRRWNLISRNQDAGGGTVQTIDETIDEAEVGWRWDEANRVQGEIGRIAIGETFEGTRQAASLAVAESAWPQLAYRIEYITSMDSVQQERGRWFRQLGSVQRGFVNGHLIPRVEVEQERRRQRVLGTDSLARTSFNFVEVRPGLAWVAETFEAGGGIEYRTEQDWTEGTMRDAATAWTVQTNVKTSPAGSFSTEANLGYRIKRYTDHFRIQERREDAESVVLNWNARFQPWQRAVETSWYYEALTERTPVLQEIFYRAGPELGEYVWEDANGDNVIQLDELLPERTPNEGVYLRTFIPSDSLASVINVQARLRLQFQPDRLWRTPGTRWQRWLAQVTSRTTLDVQEKSRDPELAQIYLLNVSRFRDSLNTLSGRLRVSQEVLLFRTKPRYGLDFSVTDLRSLTELAAGQEERAARQWRVEGRYKPGMLWAVRLAASRGLDRVLSETFASRRFDIRSLQVDPEVTYTPSRVLQLTGSVSWTQKRDAFADRHARLIKVPVQARFNQARKLSVTTRFEVANVVLRGPADRPAVGLTQFELTDGRGPGTSMLWALTGQYSINRYLQMTFQYDGRAPADAPTLHTLRMQLSAVF